MGAQRAARHPDRHRVGRRPRNRRDARPARHLARATRRAAQAAARGIPLPCSFSEPGAGVTDPLGWILAFVQHVDPITRSLLAGPRDVLRDVDPDRPDHPGRHDRAGREHGVTRPGAIRRAARRRHRRIPGRRERRLRPRPLVRPLASGARSSASGSARATGCAPSATSSAGAGSRSSSSRFLPVLHALVPLTVGMTQCGTAASWPGRRRRASLWALAYVTVGTLAAGGYRELAPQLHWAGYLFAAVVIVFFVAVLLIRRR